VQSHDARRFEDEAIAVGGDGTGEAGERRGQSVALLLEVG